MRVYGVQGCHFTWLERHQLLSTAKKHFSERQKVTLLSQRITSDNTSEGGSVLTGCRYWCAESQSSIFLQCALRYLQSGDFAKAKMTSCIYNTVMICCQAAYSHQNRRNETEPPCTFTGSTPREPPCTFAV
jgi:hypothetical protein